MAIFLSSWFATGCTAMAPSKATRPVRSTAAASAITYAERRIRCSTSWRQSSIRLPAGFVAVVAVECPLALVKVAHGHGHPVFTEQVADRGLAPLVAALRRPSARLAPGVACAVQLSVLPVLFLMGRGRQIIRPMIPTNGCWAPLQRVLTALQLVPWLTVHPAAR